MSQTSSSELRRQRFMGGKDPLLPANPCKACNGVGTVKTMHDGSVSKYFSEREEALAENRLCPRAFSVVRYEKCTACNGTGEAPNEPHAT